MVGTAVVTTVAVDASPALREVRTGTEVYARELLLRLPRLAPDLRWLLLSSRPGELDQLDLLVLPQRRLWSQTRVPLALARLRPDLFFAPSHVVPFLAPGRTLTVVHDLAFERFPAAYSSAGRLYLRLTTRWAVQRCPLVLTVSEATASDLVEIYGVDRARIRVVPPGIAAPPRVRVNPARLRQLGVETPFVLHVGRVEARKNQEAAAAAVARVGGLRLVCAGPVIDLEAAERLHRQGAILLGRVDQLDLEQLFLAAEALVFPSLYEGFGFPVVEAMARGLPVVTVRSSSLPEVAGEAALYVSSPFDVGGIADAIRSVVGDEALRKRLVTAGRRQAAGFSWDATAAGVLEVIRELLSR